MHDPINNFKIWPIAFGLKSQFEAMASQCEMVVHDSSIGFQQLKTIAKKCIQEIKRIENKYSRYLPHSVISLINQSSGLQQHPIDRETFELLSFSDELFKSSQGLFDIDKQVSKNVMQILEIFHAHRIEFQKNDDAAKPYSQLQPNVIASFIY